MSEEPTTPPPPTAAQEERPGGVISADNLLRVLLVMLAVWTFFSGLALTFFQNAADATIGGGLEGGEATAAQRLLGVHLLVLAPIYGLLVWRWDQYRSLIWVPYAAQGGVVAVTAFDILTGKRDFVDGALPLIVAATFLVLLVYVWRAERRAAEAPPEVTPPAGEAEATPAPSEPEPEGTEPTG